MGACRWEHVENSRKWSYFPSVFSKRNSLLKLLCFMSHRQSRREVRKVRCMKLSFSEKKMDTVCISCIHNMHLLEINICCVWVRGRMCFWSYKGGFWKSCASGGCCPIQSGQMHVFIKTSLQQKVLAARTYLSLCGSSQERKNTDLAGISGCQIGCTRD